MTAVPLGRIACKIAYNPSTKACKPGDFEVSALMTDSSLGHAAWTHVRDDGTFELRIRPGHITIRGREVTSKWRFRRVTLNGHDITYDGVDLSNAEVSGVIVEFH